LRNPEQNVPRAIPCPGIAGVVYVLVSWLAVLSPSELAASNAPLLDVVRRAQPFPQVIFTLIALFAVLNTALLNFVTASRLLFGDVRAASSLVGKLHPQRRTPIERYL